MILTCLVPIEYSENKTDTSMCYNNSFEMIKIEVTDKHVKAVVEYLENHCPSKDLSDKGIIFCPPIETQIQNNLMLFLKENSKPADELISENCKEESKIFNTPNQELFDLEVNLILNN